MKVKLKVEKEVEVKTLQVKAGARYWEDATVDGAEDTYGSLIPCRSGKYWLPLIDIDNGKILNWEAGKTADIHYKVCDAGTYTVLDENNNQVVSIDGYVPGTMCPEGEGYGDYIIMKVDADGQIANWKFSIADFIEE